jgi:hypothetical protein
MNYKHSLLLFNASEADGSDTFGIRVTDSKRNDDLIVTDDVQGVEKTRHCIT